MRRLALLAILMFAVLAPSAMAHGRPDSPFDRPAHRRACWAQWWKTVLEIPVSENPLTGQRRPVHHARPPRARPRLHRPSGEIACTVDKHTSILAITFTSECSDAEDPPFFGATPRERAACARATADGVPDQRGRRSTAGSTTCSRYRTTSPDLRVRLPEDDLFGVDAALAALHRRRLGAADRAAAAGPPRDLRSARPASDPAVARPSTTSGPCSSRSAAAGATATLAQPPMGQSWTGSLACMRSR